MLRTATAVMFAMLCCLARPLIAAADNVNLDVLTPQLESYIQKNPRDPMGYYTLGLAQKSAYIRRLERVEIDAAGEGKLPIVAPDDEQPPAGLPASRPFVLKQLQGSLSNLAKAVELSRDDPRFRLALAQLLEAGSDDATTVETLPRLAPPGRIMNAGQLARTQQLMADLGDDAKREAAMKELRKFLDDVVSMLHAGRAEGSDARKQAAAELLSEFWREQAIAGYLQAYQTAVKRELPAIQKKQIAARASLSWQGVEGYLRMVEKRGPRGNEATMLPKLKQVKAALEMISP